MPDIVLGNDTRSGKPIAIDNKDRVRGTYVIGRTGFGKSILLEQLAVQDAEKGHGFCFLDPHGDVLDHILCRIPQERIDRGDVIYLEALDYKFPFGLNLYECASNDPVSMRQTFNQVEQVFAKVFGMSKETPRLSQFVRNITATLLVNQGYTMCEIPLLLQDEGFRQQMVGNLLTDSPARPFWKGYDNLRPLERLDRSESTLDRIDALINNDILRYIVGQSKTTINFQEVMNSGKVLLVKLPGYDEDITTLLGSVIINQLLLAALARKDIPEKQRRQFNIYADEFQRFAIPSFGQLLVEARKYRIATICANQVLNDLGEQLRPRMLNAGCLVVFNVQGEDAEDMAGEFNYTPPLAIKPKPVIPSNVLDHLNRHQHQKVRDFYSNFVMRLEEAAKHQPYTEMKDGSRLAYYNFGEGNYEYDINEIPKVLDLLNRLFREALEKDLINIKIKSRIISLMAPSLGFSDYWKVHYVSPPDILDGLFLEVRNKDELLKMRDEQEIIMFGEKTGNYYYPGVNYDWLAKAKQNYTAQQTLCEFYEEWFDGILEILISPEGKIGVPSTQWQDTLLVQQTHTDKRAEIANALTHLPVGRAWVRQTTSDGERKVIVEHVIDTSMPSGFSEKELERKRIQVMEYTRAKYCKPRAEVEEEIRHRQESDNQPTTKRKHTL